MSWSFHQPNSWTIQPFCSWASPMKHYLLRRKFTRQIPILRPDTESWRCTNLCSPQPCDAPSPTPGPWFSGWAVNIAKKSANGMAKLLNANLEKRETSEINFHLSVFIVLNDPVPGLVAVLAKSQLPFWVVEQVWFILKKPLRHLFQLSSTLFWIFLVCFNDP